MDSETTEIRRRAVQDAKEMQKVVNEKCRKLNIVVPGYELVELTGKGSYGRVYKAIEKSTKREVAIKITDIQTGDEEYTAARTKEDFFENTMKEITALRALKEINAPNVNHMIDGLLIDGQLWMITEYCAGGSVKTLMHPLKGKGLKECYIIVILREVARAMAAVHKAGILHRDIKCGNVLIAENGDVQLCDFGVSSAKESASDKRKTKIGSLHWMAPELHEKVARYGAEVDVWSFGCMAYEMANGGAPPNARLQPDLNMFKNIPMPRLDDTEYSNDLCNLVESCLQINPEDRPTFEELLQHKLFANSEQRYPTSLLRELVGAFKRWESIGGIRRSLFWAGGAQGPAESIGGEVYDDEDDEWNFSTTYGFDAEVGASVDNDDVRRVYGSNVDLATFDQTEKPAPPPAGPRRRRPPPGALPQIKRPLERVFDQGTERGYEEHSKEHYFTRAPSRMSSPEPEAAPPPSSDLPLRQPEAKIITRESMIDLDLGDMDMGGFSSASFGGGLTLRPGDYQDDSTISLDDEDYDDPSMFDGRAMQEREATERQDRPRTQDWSFASAAPTAKSGASTTQNRRMDSVNKIAGDDSARSKPKRVPTMAEPGEEVFKLGGGRRPSLIHAATEPAGVPFNYRQQAPQAAPPSATGRDRESLIDLDFGMAPTVSSYGSNQTTQYTPDSSRPQTAMSNSGSEFGIDSNPFELEGRFQRNLQINGQEGRVSRPPREPSLYVMDSRPAGHSRQISNVSDANSSDVNSGSDAGRYAPSRLRGHATMASQSFSDLSDAEYTSYPPHLAPNNRARPQMPQVQSEYPPSSQASRRPTGVIPLPPMPSMAAMDMSATEGENAAELGRLLRDYNEMLGSTFKLFQARRPDPVPSRYSRDGNAGSGGSSAGGRARGQGMN